MDLPLEILKHIDGNIVLIANARLILAPPDDSTNICGIQSLILLIVYPLFLSNATLQAFDEPIG